MLRRRPCNSVGSCLPLGASFRLISQSTPRPGWAVARALQNSRPVIGRAPGHVGLWFAYGHAHWGVPALGPTTGQLLADMIRGVPPFTRSCALSRRAVQVTAPPYSLIVRTTLDVGRPSPPAVFICLRIISSYEARVVTGNFGFMKSDLVALGFELIEQIHRRFGSSMLEIVHEHNSLAKLLEPGEHGLFNSSGFHILKSDKDSEIGGKGGSVCACPGIKQYGAMLMFMWRLSFSYVCCQQTARRMRSSRRWCRPKWTAHGLPDCRTRAG